MVWERLNLRGRPLRFGASIALLAALSAPALAADPQNGLSIAKTWCAACHVVEANQRRGSADVPAFSEIARRFSGPQSLAAFLADPHPRMPNMSLSRDQIDDLVSYIESVGPNPPQTPAPRTEPTLPRNG